MEFHFYPLTHTLRVKDKKPVKKRYPAWAEPALMGSDPRIPEQPTTPANEAEQAFGKPVNLTSSHGRIHIKPADRDTLFSLGAFDSGPKLVVHEYDETP